MLLNSWRKTLLNQQINSSPTLEITDLIMSDMVVQLDPEGYKAAAGASNQVNGDSGISGGAALGYEIILT